MKYNKRECDEIENAKVIKHFAKFQPGLAFSKFLSELKARKIGSQSCNR